MKILHNEKGIALVTSLMFTAITLVITMALLYMVTASTRSSGALKRYKNVTEAAYGGTDIVLKDLISASFAYSDYSARNPGTSFTSYMKDNYMVNLNTPNVSACLKTKLMTPKSQWPAACLNVTNDIKNSWDVSFNLNAATGPPYNIYSRIVDDMGHKLSVFQNLSSRTVTIAGNSAVTLYSLEGTSVTEASGATVPHYPYIYRMEVQAERSNSAEKSKITVQYAY